VPWMAMALASVAVPWILYPAVGIGSLSEAIAPAMLWKALWPVLFGGLLAVGLRRWGHKLPHIPAGDIVIGGGALTRVAAFCGAAMERVDALLRQWQIAVLSLVIVAILLAVAMMAGG
jgi:multicomponent Na+:H+ antiporter subunit A